MRQPRVLIPLALLGTLLPALLVLSAFRTYRALDAQRTVYLRSRVASIAARLETFPPGMPEDQWRQTLLDEEEALWDLAILARDSSPPELTDLWEGRELYRTQALNAGGERVLRTYIPFHSAGGMRLARIDIAESAADFLVEHARHHLLLVAAASLMIVALAFLTARSVLRARAAEQRQAEMRHLARIGEMSAVLAHEIRNPLGTIKGFAQLLGEKLRGEHAALLEPILDQSARLERLSADLLVYGRKAEPRSRAVQAEALAESMRLHARQILPGFEASAAPLTLTTDPQLLEQVLLNLLRNAAEAAGGGENARVRFEIESDGDSVVLRLSDNGPGLSEEARRRLFEPFYTSKASGTGLGLSISRKLTEALGGTLRLDNAASGGTVAEVRLPGESNGTHPDRG
ncbi:MAG: HAMP domain-containing sensor histidine kinase [Bryobacteraceae bacterium]